MMSSLLFGGIDGYYLGFIVVRRAVEVARL